MLLQYVANYQGLPNHQEDTITLYKGFYRILDKKVNDDQIEIGDTIIVSIEVENTGTISIDNIVVNDMITYSQLDFSLQEGKLVNLIGSLDPGEKVAFNYTFKAKRQILVNLKPTSIKFYYLNENEAKSNSVIVKIITPKIRHYFFIILPSLIVFGILILYFWQIKKYKKKRIEFQRSEIYIFGLSSRETILKIEHDLRERLSILSHKSTEKTINFESNEPLQKYLDKNE